MQILVVGVGNVGMSLVGQLSKEQHNITVVDTNSDNVEFAVNNFDVMGLVGNGASYQMMCDAGIEGADLMIAVTNSDELNLLCCLIAKKAGGCRTIARVRNPEYRQEVDFIKEELGLSMVINPESASATEVVRLMEFPSATKVETFARGRAELVTIVLEENSYIVGKSLRKLQAELKSNVLFAVVSRAGEVIIPDGNFVPQVKDEISFIGTSKNMVKLFRRLHLPTVRVSTSMIIGGGAIGYYLAKQLIDYWIRVTLFEKDHARCKELSSKLPEAIIIHADGTDKDMLLEEGIADVGSFITLTGLDEENIMLSLFAKSVSKAKCVTKIHHVNYGAIIDSLNIGSILYPKTITAERIVRFVRGLSNSFDSNIETLYSINDGKAEVLEFLIGENAPVVDIPLAQLNPRMKDGILIASIMRGGEVISPQGSSTIQKGDSVIIVTTQTGFHDIRDILK